MTAAVITMQPIAMARLWDRDFNLIATESCTSQDLIHNGLTIHGSGPIHQAVKALMQQPDNMVYLTIDPDSHKLHDFKNRYGYTVMTIDMDERRCECGNPIITTTITGEPTQATA